MERNADYKEMYFDLFNGISEIISKLEKLQQEAEEKYIAASDK